MYPSDQLLTIEVKVNKLSYTELHNVNWLLTRSVIQLLPPAKNIEEELAQYTGDIKLLHLQKGDLDGRHEAVVDSFY